MNYSDAELSKIREKYLNIKIATNGVRISWTRYIKRMKITPIIGIMDRIVWSIDIPRLYAIKMITSMTSDAM